MKRKRKSKKQYMTAIDSEDICKRLADVGMTRWETACMLNPECTTHDDSYKKFKRWMSLNRMPKHKKEILDGIIRRVASENETA